MVKDRLAELRRKVNISESDDDEGEDQTDHAHIKKGDEQSALTLTTNLKNGSVQIHMENRPLEAFLERVEALKKMEDDLKNDVDRVKILHNIILSHTLILSSSQTQEKSKRKTELNDLTSTIKHKSQTIRTKLKEMGESIEVKDTSRITVRIRIQSTQHSALLRNFSDVMHEYHETKTQYMNRCKDKIKLDLEISETPLTVDEVMEQENFSVFTAGLSMQSEQAKEALYQAKALRDDILKIEQTLVELQKLFKEMAVLIQSQGETIDRIETHVAETVEYVSKGEDQLDKAHGIQRQARKKKIWIYIILTVIALLFILIIYLSA